MKKIILTVCHAVLTGAVAFAAMTSEDLSFVASSDGTTQKYVKLTPANLPSEKIDVVIWLHGHGSDRTQVSQSRGECAGSRDFCEENGMLLVSPDYRAKTSWMGPAAEADMLQLLTILKADYSVGRVFFVGGSMGGSSSLTFAGLHPDLVDGVTGFNPLADHTTYENFQDAIAASFGGSKTEVPDEYAKRSAITHVSELAAAKVPIALTLGGADTSVPPASARQLAAEINALNPGQVYVDEVATRGHETDYNATLKALRQMLCRANGTDYDEEYGGGTTGGGDMPAGATSAVGLVAWWPFGKHGLNDASGHGYSLVAGPEAVIGETVTLAGSSAGNAQSGLSASGIPFSQMEAVTVDMWLRYSAAPEWEWQLVELSSDFNSSYGAFLCYNDSSAGCVYSGVHPAGYSMVQSGSNALAEKVGAWRHVVAVYAKGAYGDNLRLYVDGVDVTTSSRYTSSTTGVVFPDKTLYFGGRNGKATVLGEMDSMKVWSRALTADEVAFNYAAGRDFCLLSTVTGYPTDVPCSQMSPSYGPVAFTNGESVSFSAKCDLKDIGIVGWRIYTNAADSAERVLMLSGTGASGSFTYSGVVCNLEWQFSLPPHPMVAFTSPMDVSEGKARFSYLATNGSAGDVRVLAVCGSSPTSMDVTNELALVTSACACEARFPVSTMRGALCVRLVALGPTGSVVAVSPIKVWRQTVNKLCYYPFGDMELHDATGNGLNLKAKGSVTLENGGATFASGAQLVTDGKLDLSYLDSVVASCWVRNAGSATAGAALMEQNSPAYYNLNGAIMVCYDTSLSCLMSFVGYLKVNGNPIYSCVASEKGDFDSFWHNVAVIYSKKAYPDDIKVYVDGVNKSREITEAEKSNYRGSATTTTFASAPLTLGGRGSSVSFVGQMDEVVVAECSADAADAVAAQIYGEGLWAVKGEVSPDGVTVEVPEDCPADQVFPPVGTTFGYGPGEPVPVVAEGKAFDRWLCTLSTNGINSAEWKTWRRLSAASGAFQHPGVPVKVTWRKRTGSVLVVR